MNVNLSDIIEAIEFTDDMTHSFLDKVTGKIVTVNEFGMTSKEQEAVYDMLDEHGFYRLPDQYELNGYNTMEKFIETLPSPARDRLEIAISDRGAFRRFKDEIRRLGVEKAWYQYEADENRRKAIEWCEDNEIEIIDNVIS